MGVRLMFRKGPGSSCRSREMVKMGLQRQCWPFAMEIRCSLINAVIVSSCGEEWFEVGHDRYVSVTPWGLAHQIPRGCAPGFSLLHWRADDKKAVSCLVWEFRLSATFFLLSF